MDKGKGDLLQADTGRGVDLLGIDANEATKPATGNVWEIDRRIGRWIMTSAGRPDVGLVLWDGQAVYSPASPVATVRINDRRALYGLITRLDVNFGDAYSAGRIEVDGDLVAGLESVYLALREVAPPGSWRRRLSEWRNRPSANSQATAQGNIHHHYDLGNEFYSLWLDPRMLYTCAYYPTEDATLEQAQLAKMEHVCRKLQLAPGQRVVEAGCGWGALAMYMAREYDVEVTAYNISTEQLAYARERAAAEGLDKKVTFVEADYRTIDQTYDRFVSVGMLEHVGVHNFKELGSLVSRVLAPDGLALIHSIGRNAPAANNPWIEKRIFPGSRPPSLSEMCEIFEPQRLSVLDIENLRLHYARTCDAWLEQFDQVTDKVSDMYDDAFVRAWRLYLAGSVAAFTTGSLQLFQVVFTHEYNNQVPRTRNHQYVRPHV